MEKIPCESPHENQSKNAKVAQCISQDFRGSVWWGQLFFFLFGSSAPGLDARLRVASGYRARV